MAPSLQPGDWVLSGPGRAELGDVWLLSDPMQSDQPVMRRIIAASGSVVSWSQGQVSIDGERPRLREMGRDESRIVLSEANQWLVEIRAGRLRWATDELLVPPEHVYLLADSRYGGADSRWWGSVPESSLQRELWLRVGPSTAWRGSWSWGGRDGPWRVEPPSMP